MNPTRQRTYAVVGTGAVGGFYGALLHRAGFEVHFLLRSDYRHVRRRGLRIQSKHGSFRLRHVHAHDRARHMPRCDVVLVALKATQNGALPSILPHIVKKDGLVLLLQNGLGMERGVAGIVGARRVAGALSFLCSNKQGPGHIRHLDYGALSLAEYSPTGRPRGVTPRLEAVARDFRRAGIEATVLDDLVLARWKKLVWNIPFNGLSVVLNTTTDRIMACPDTRQLALDLMQEVVAAARAAGRRIPPSFVKKMVVDTDKMPPYRTSMMIDFDRGRPMEVEAIFGNPLRAAKKAGAKVPKIEMLYQQLKFLDDEVSGVGCQEGKRQTGAEHSHGAPTPDT